MSPTQSPTALLARICPSCHDIVPLAATASAGTFYLGWICPSGLAADTEDCLFDVIGVYATCEEAKWNLVTEEYYASLEPPDPEVDAIRPLSSRA